MWSPRRGPHHRPGPVDGPPGHAGGAWGCPLLVPASRGSLALRVSAWWGWSSQGVPGLPVPGKPWTLWMKPRACTQDSSQTLHSHAYEKPTVCTETLMRLSPDPPPGPIQGWSESPQMGRSRQGEVGDVPTVLAWISGRAGTWPDWWVGQAEAPQLGLEGKAPRWKELGWGAGREGQEA